MPNAKRNLDRLVQEQRRRGENPPTYAEQTALAFRRLAYIDDPVLFCRDGLNFTPDDWQARLLGSNSRRIIVNIARQQGKSLTAAAKALHRAIFFPESLILVVAPAVKQSAEFRRKVDDLLLRVKDVTAKKTDNRSELELSNGSRIIVAAADSDTIRSYTAHMVIEDEAAMVPDAVHEAIKPMLFTTQGQHIMLSTPKGMRDHHYPSIWHDGKNWERYQVTAWENKRVSKAVLDALAEEKEDLEMRGRLWYFEQEYECSFVAAAQGLVYPFDRKKNLTPTLPTERGWSFCLGIDYGFTDSTAFVVLGWQKDDPHVYVVESFDKRGLLAPEAAEMAKALTKKYPFARIVGDTSGFGKGYVEEARRRFHLPIEAAEKNNKRGFIELMASDLKAGFLKLFPGNDGLIEEWSRLPWDEEREMPADGYKDHLCLVAGTKIRTPRGERNIERLRIGDKVMTPAGSRRVSAITKTDSRPTWQLVTVGGRSLTGTANHPVFIAPGSPVRLDALTQGCTVMTWNRLFSSAPCTAGTRTRRAGSCVFTSSRAVGDGFIGPSGSTFVAPFRRGMSSTIETGIRSTTVSLTSNASRIVSIMPSTPRPNAQSRVGVGSTGFVTWRPNGTGPKRGSFSTPILPRGHGWPVSRSLAHASSAAISSHQKQAAPPSARGNALRSGGERPGWTTPTGSALNASAYFAAIGTRSRRVALDHVMRVGPTGHAETVYNLTVEDEHCYFANGVLVANSDACLYAWRAACHYLEREQAARPAKGTPEAFKLEAEEMFEARIAEVQEKGRDWWEQQAEGEVKWLEQATPSAGPDWMN